MSRLSWKLAEDGFELTLDRTESLPLGERIGDLTRNAEEASALLALDQLWMDEQLDEMEPGRWLLRYERLPTIDSDQARALGLPQPDGRITADLDSSGILTSPDFRITVRFRSPETGPLDPERRRGPLFVLEADKLVLLDQRKWELQQVVLARPEPSEGTEGRVRYLCRCVQAGRAAGASINSYLTDNEYEVIESLSLDPRETGDGIAIGVRAGALSHDDLSLPNGRAKPFPTIQDASGRRRRFVLGAAARETFERVQQRRHLVGQEVPEFLLNPEAFVPEGLDLSEFSERVRGFKTRVYNSRPYVHVRSEPRGWLDFDAGVQLEDVTASEQGEGPRAKGIGIEDFEALVDRARRSGERFVRHGDAWVEVDPKAGEEFLGVVRKLREARAREGRLDRRIVLDVIPNVELLEFQVEVPPDLRGKPLELSDLTEVPPPRSLRAQLDHYQLLGFRWLHSLYEREAGGLLADEMGVGKTVQVIALLAHLHEQRALAPSLVVVPKTLIANWESELRRFAPEIERVWIHMGPYRSRSVDFFSNADVVLTSYETTRLDQTLLGRIDWKVVVADEAQFIKNPTAGRTSVMKALKARQTLALTGTPVENGLIEFWCIMDYVQPGLLGSWSEFRKTFERPLTAAASEEERQRIAQDLIRRLDPHYVRRVKEDVLASLPEKRVMPPIGATLGPLQKQRYHAIVADAKARGREALLAAITRLLMVCAHPRAGFDDWEALDGEALIQECPKLQRTMEILGQVQRANEKALVFTEWKSVQRILQRAIWVRFGTVAEIVNGDVTTRRQSIIDAFRCQDGFGVLILNPGVAGFGLNLVEANHVIHYTRPWNPAKESQATDRVHRRGQTRPVSIYYPTVLGTVEERLAQLLADKERLARDVLRPSREKTVTAEDLVEDL